MRKFPSLRLRLLPWLNQEFYRCVTVGCPRCGKLVAYSQIRRGVCAGHKVVAARHSTLLEDVKLILGRIR